MMVVAMAMMMTILIPLGHVLIHRKFVGKYTGRGEWEQSAVVVVVVGFHSVRGSLLKANVNIE